MAEDLLTAADKYEILPLVELCAQYLADTLNNENACARLVLADRHHITKLKSAAINFIKQNVRDIKAMIGYKELFATHHDLVIEIMEIMCISK
jgi:speckle-type POZ protein